MEEGFPVCGAAEFTARYAEKRKGKTEFFAFFSSYVGAITTDPCAMQIPMDDHMVHRGHGVFDTATLKNGRLYRLDEHLGRLMRSAQLAQLTNVPTLEYMKKAIIATAKAAQNPDASVRFWLSAGPGNYLLSPKGCEETCFYVVLFDAHAFHDDSEKHGVDERTIRDIPMKPKLLAEMKSNNYMLNVLLHMTAMERGGMYGIHIKNDDYLAESCIGNVALVIGNDLITPPFEEILRGLTMCRVLELMEEHGKKIDITVVQRPVHVDELFKASEIFITSGDFHITPVRSLDEKKIGSGSPGRVYEFVKLMLEDEVEKGEKFITVLC